LILFNVHIATLEDKEGKSAGFGEPSFTPVTKLDQAGSPKDCLELDLLAIADPRGSAMSKCQPWLGVKNLMAFASNIFD
jgi:hypothetical protein